MRVLVIGAGIGGLTFANALRYFHRPGGSFTCSVEIAEQRQSLGGGVGIVLHPNGLNVLDLIGLSDDTRVLGHVIQRMEISRDGRDFQIDMNEVWGSNRLPVALLRNDLHLALSGYLQCPEGIPVRLRMGCRVEELLQKENEVVVRFDNGEDEVFDLVVGADGAHSQTRRTLFPHTEALSTGLLYYRFITRANMPFGPHVWKTFERNEGSYGFIPVGNGLWHCFVQLVCESHACPRGEEEQVLRKHIVSWDRLLEAALDARCGSIHSGFAYTVQPENWILGRCVLMGDAAHAVSPTLSEGGSLAIEDALVLSLCLYGSGTVDTALRRYADAREKRCMKAWRMALLQLNSARRRQQEHTRIHEPGAHTRILSKMYEFLLESPLPDHLQCVYDNILLTI